MLQKIFQTATFRQSLITISATAINGALGFLFYVVLARNLGPASFGLFTVSISVLTLIADLVDLGINTGLVKFVSANLKEDKEKALKYLKLSLELKVIVWLVIVVAGILLSPFIAANIFNKPELTSPLQLVMFGVGSALLFNFATSSLQAFQKFKSWSFINIFSNALRLLLIFLLIISLNLNLFNSILIYILMPLFGFLVTLFIIPTKEFIKQKNEFKLFSKLFSFNIWVVSFTAIAALSTRLDLFLTTRYLNETEIGLYGFSTQMVSVIPQVIGAISIVTAPKFSSFTDLKTMTVYLKKLLIMMLGLVVLGILAIPLIPFVINLLVGPGYLLAFPIITILVVSMLIFLLASAINNSIIYYFGKPQIFLPVSIGHLIIMGGLGYFMIINYGILGTALTVLIGSLFNFLTPLIWVIFQLKKS